MEDKLKSALDAIETPPPSDGARARALAAAMEAFDAQKGAQSAGARQKQNFFQGKAPGGRLRSIGSRFKGLWTMDMRIPMGATLAALLVLPVGVMYLGSTYLGSTALTPTEPALQGLPIGDAAPDAGVTAEQTAREPEAAQAPRPAPASVPARVPSPVPADLPPAMSADQFMVEQSFVRAMPMGEAMAMPGGGDRFTAFEEGGVQITAENPVSTFSIDVDTTAYAYVRRMLELGQTPPPDAVRIEELINYFSYDYPAPAAGDEAPFTTSLAVSPSPWAPDNRLIQIGIEGQAVNLETVPPANLVLLIDTSGSMDAPDKLPLLKRAFTLLVNEMGADDTIAIVTYAGSAGVVLEPTPASQKSRILAAIEALTPGGSTAGAQGIEAAYRLAGEAMIAGGTNRVLLATDGDFNVGVADPDALERLIETQREAGISLSVLGFGTGNYNDGVMQALAQAGNGNAAYIDSYSEARKVLVEELGGTLVTIAKDVKIQVEFNPVTVSEYRLIGYETRALAREDFNNDAVDAGDIGAGHSVTAIYEITPVGAPGSVDPLRYGEAQAAGAGSPDEYGFLKLRYKHPEAETSELIETPIPVEGDGAIGRADVEFASAVAAFGQKLKGSSYVRAMDWDDIRALAVAGRGEDPTGRRGQFIGLIDLAASLR